jgi:hypothetical protein
MANSMCVSPSSFVMLILKIKQRQIEVFLLWKGFWKRYMNILIKEMYEYYAILLFYTNRCFDYKLSYWK